MIEFQENTLRTFFCIGLTALILTGCAAPMSQQISNLNSSAACCTELAQIKTSGTLGGETQSALTPETPLVMVNGKRSPAVRFLVPAALVGHQIQMRLAPMDSGELLNLSRGLAFSPVTPMFLAADGTPVPILVDSGTEAGPAHSFAFSYALWRTVTVPDGAASAVFYADPVKYGVDQTFAYRFGGLMPAGGILIAQSANAKGLYRIFGEFSVTTL